MSNRPLFIVSLDFELFWGMFDKQTLAQYGANVAGVHTALPEILSLFARYGIHATWATVGLLMCEEKRELESLLLPHNARPVYRNERASSYHHIAHAQIGQTAQDDPYHYGAHLVRQILQTPFQELASHTFSHYYVLDEQSRSEMIFKEDCEAFARACAKFNTSITSIVFPRNQISQEALRTIRDCGFTAYRGNPTHFLYSEKKESSQTNILLRMLRLLDAYVNISGHHTYTLPTQEGPMLKNIQASRFLRPYSARLSFLETFRIARIKRSMTHAAKRGEVFHLWWHPHNFGINRKENLQILIEILEHYTTLQQTYGMESASMREAASLDEAL